MPCFLAYPPFLWQRWFINGEVSCFTGPHLPLALLAMAVLLLCFLLIPLTTIISLDILKVHTHSVHSHLSGCFLTQESASVSLITDDLSVLFPLQKPRWLRHFVPPLTAVFREEVKWWSGVELGRRFLFLLFFIPFPRNAVRNIQNQCLLHGIENVRGVTFLKYLCA